MKPGMALMPLASIVRRPCVGTAPAPTETILPPRTMIVPDSITWPLPTITRALVMATSCAVASVGAINPVPARHADTNSLFIYPHSLNVIATARPNITTPVLDLLRGRQSFRARELAQLVVRRGHFP